MLSNVVISLDHVSKLFYKQEQRTMKELIPALFRGGKGGNWFWALQDVSLQVKRGDTVGIVGSNGSGKSTLLKLIAGVTRPTEGKIGTSGRIAPLIELGAGFHSELTGRENAYLNGVILGMTRKEIDAKFQEIVNFADLWDFIDQPIKHYSSGMYLRLAFSVAIHTAPEILLVDEILAVGDEEFQKKCLSKIGEYLHKGGTLLFVSHDIKLVKQICTHIVHIEKGKIIRSYENPQGKKRS